MQGSPLPAPTKDMNFATPDLFNPLTAESFQTAPDAGGMDVRDLGFSKLSNGKIGGIIFRATGDHPPEARIWHMHNLEYQIGYITKGWMLYEFEGVGELRVEAGTAIYHLPRNRLRILDRSRDFEGIWIESPAQDKIVTFFFNEESGTYQEFSFERILS